MRVNLEMGFLNLNKCNMTWHKYDAPNAIYCKQRKKKETTLPASYGYRENYGARSKRQENQKKGKWCCTTYGTSGQHHNIEWCNKIVDHGVSNNIRGSQDTTIKRTMHLYHDDLEGNVIIHVKWVHLKHIWHNMSRWSICMYGKLGCKRKGNATGASCEGSSAKVHHHHISAGLMYKKDSTILFIRKNYPKSIYNILYLGQGYTMCNMWGVMCKIHHHLNNASSYEQMNSTMLFLIFC